jgi:hypothetical protein
MASFAPAYRCLSGLGPDHGLPVVTENSVRSEKTGVPTICEIGLNRYAVGGGAAVGSA